MNAVAGTARAVVTATGGTSLTATGSTFCRGWSGTRFSNGLGINASDEDAWMEALSALDAETGCGEKSQSLRALRLLLPRVMGCLIKNG